MADIKFEIVEQFGSISAPGDKWAKELNLIRWNNADAKYDLRTWSPTHEKMGKGITLSKAELLALRDLLNALDLK